MARDKKNGAFLALGIVFLVLGLSSSKAFLALGIVFLAIGFAGSRRR